MAPDRWNTSVGIEEFRLELRGKVLILEVGPEHFFMKGFEIGMLLLIVVNETMPVPLGVLVSHADGSSRRSPGRHRINALDDEDPKLGILKALWHRSAA